MIVTALKGGAPGDGPGAAADNSGAEGALYASEFTTAWPTGQALPQLSAKSRQQLPLAADDPQRIWSDIVAEIHRTRPAFAEYHRLNRCPVRLTADGTLEVIVPSRSLDWMRYFAQAGARPLEMAAAFAGWEDQKITFIGEEEGHG